MLGILFKLSWSFLQEQNTDMYTDTKNDANSMVYFCCIHSFLEGFPVIITG
jgi:hypothetical protein